MKRKRRTAGFGLAEVILIIVIVAALLYVLARAGVFGRETSHMTAQDSQNARQACLASLMYAGDYDDRIAPTMNGWLSRLQNRGDKDLTINCPGPGTQDLAASDAAGSRATRTWVELLKPYIKQRRLWVSPQRPDVHGYFASDPLSVGDKDYNPEGATWRNQGRFPDYGLNYMFLSPLQIPKDKRDLPNPVNYAEGRGILTTEPADPSATVFIVDSQRGLDDPNNGFFVVNAPGMWPKFANTKEGLVAFWRGTKGSGDWVGTNSACAATETPCSKPTQWHGFVYTGFNDGANATFIDGHVKYMKSSTLAAGTNYPAAIAGSDGSGAVITDTKHYMWDLK